MIKLGNYSVDGTILTLDFGNFTESTSIAVSDNEMCQGAYVSVDGNKDTLVGKWSSHSSYVEMDKFSDSITEEYNFKDDGTYEKLTKSTSSSRVNTEMEETSKGKWEYNSTDGSLKITGKAYELGVSLPPDTDPDTEITVTWFVYMVGDSGFKLVKRLPNDVENPKDFIKKYYIFQKKN